MTIRRLATSDTIIEALVPLMSTKPILSYEQAAAALREGGLIFGDGEDAVDQALDDALDFGVGSEALFIVDDWIVHPEALAASKVFTHRITADDVSGEVIELFPDCAPWLPALTAEVVNDAAAELDDESDPEAAGDIDPDDDVRAVALAVAGADSIRAQLIGLGTIDDSGAMLILPDGTLAGANLTPGDLITLRLIDGVIHLDTITEAPAGTDAVVAHLRAIKAESTLVESVAEFLFRCILADRDLFDAPTAPLTELLDAADIHPEGDLIGEISEEASANIREHHVAQAAGRYDLKRHEARLLLDLADALADHQLTGAAVDSDLAGRGRGACADPWFAFALAEECLRRRWLADALVDFATAPPAGAPRAVRGGLHFVQGRTLELSGDPAAAIAAYRMAAELHESPFALQRLAQMELYRGNFVAARSLLDQSGALPSHPLYEDIDRASRHTLPAEPTRKLGRNEPCWCGSGRKFKVCHGRAGAAAPLSHRAPGLYDRASVYVFDRAASEVVTMLRWATAAAGGPVPEQALVPVIVDLLLIEDHLMADFAETYAAILPDDEVMVLEQWHLEANRSVFDIEAVVPGESMTLRDLRTGDRYEVVERSGSQQVQVGWFICTRVADVAGQYQIFGGIEPVALNQREGLMELLDSSPTARQLMARLAARFAPPAVLSPEGDPMVICEARYDVADPASLRRILDDLFDESPEDGAEWTWSEEISSDQWRILASLTLTGGELLIATSTEQRLDRVLALLETAGADLVETEVDRISAAELMRGTLPGSGHADDEFLDGDLIDDEVLDGEDPEDDDGPTPALGMSMEDALANPEVAQAIATMMAGYEKRWLDESIPALSGLTPRQAAADPTRRADLIRLLDSLPAKGSPYEMDSGRLRTALGF